MSHQGQTRGTVLLTALLASSLLWAAGPEAPASAPAVQQPASQQPAPQKTEAAADAARAMQQRANPLNLTPAQQQELTALRGARVNFEQEMRKLEGELMDLANAESYDKAKVEALAKQIASKTETHLTSHAKQLNAFYKSLSPEQRKQFKAFEDRRRKMMEQRMGPQAGGKRPIPPPPGAKPANAQQQPAAPAPAPAAAPKP